jgi:hypothetical protein
VASAGEIVTEEADCSKHREHPSEKEL